MTTRGGVGFQALQGLRSEVLRDALMDFDPTAGLRLEVHERGKNGVKRNIVLSETVLRHRSGKIQLETVRAVI